ncbi:hypothetical protein N9L68_08310 [bacterium]|nr:hypothetical protein [bacterium]
MNVQVKAVAKGFASKGGKAGKGGEEYFKGKGKGKGKAPPHISCYTCGGNHWQAHYPRKGAGKGTGGLYALQEESWESWKDDTHIPSLSALTIVNPLMKETSESDDTSWRQVRGKKQVEEISIAAKHVEAAPTVVTNAFAELEETSSDADVCLLDILLEEESRDKTVRSKRIKKEKKIKFLAHLSGFNQGCAHHPQELGVALGECKPRAIGP